MDHSNREVISQTSAKGGYLGLLRRGGVGAAQSGPGGGRSSASQQSERS